MCVFLAEYNTNGDERTYAFGLASSTQGVWEWENTICKKKLFPQKLNRL